MNRNLLVAAISKVYLDLKDVDDYYIFWSLEKGVLELAAGVTAHKTSTAAFIVLQDIPVQDSKFIIRNPDKLIKKLGIADEDVSVSIQKGYDHKLILKDKTYEQEFILCDPMVVKQTQPEIEEPENYDVIIDFDSDFMTMFSKAKKADGAEVLTIDTMGSQVMFELGEDNAYSNKSRFYREHTNEAAMFKLLFSADIIQEIFDSNKGAVGLMYVYNEGLMKLSFCDYSVKPHIINVTYFLVALDTLS